MIRQTLGTFHCISCGKVAEADMKLPPPKCCGIAMTNAFQVKVDPNTIAPRTPSKQPN